MKEAIDSGKPLVNEKNLKAMFPEVQGFSFLSSFFFFWEIIVTIKLTSAILAVNLELLSNLETRFQSWSPTQQIGDIFLKLAEYLRIYVGLVNGYSTALELINKNQVDNPAFKHFLEVILLLFILFIYLFIYYFNWEFNF